MDFKSWPERLSKEDFRRRKDACTVQELSKLTTSKEFLNYVKDKRRSHLKYATLLFCALLLLGCLGFYASRNWRPTHSGVYKGWPERGLGSDLVSSRDGETDSWSARLRDADGSAWYDGWKIKELQSQVARDLAGSAWYDDNKRRELQHKLLSQSTYPQPLSDAFSDHISGETPPQESIPEDEVLELIEEHVAANFPDPNEAETRFQVLDEDTWGPVCAILFGFLLCSVAGLTSLRSRNRAQTQEISRLHQDRAPLQSTAAKLHESERTVQRLLLEAKQMGEGRDAMLQDQSQTHAMEIEKYKEQQQKSNAITEELEKQLAGSKRDYDSQTRDTDALAKDHENLKAALNFADAQVTSLQAQKAKLEIDLQADRANESAHQAEIKALNTALNEKEQARKEFAVELEAVHDQRDSLLGNVSGLEDELKQTTEALGTVRSELESLKEQLAEKSSALESTEAQLSHVSEEQKRNSELLASTGFQLEQKSQNLVLVENELDDVKEQLRAFNTELSATMSDKDSEIAYLLQDVHATESKNVVLQSAHNDAQDELRGLRADREVQERILSSMKVKVDEMWKQIERKTTERALTFSPQTQAKPRETNTANSRELQKPSNGTHNIANKIAANGAKETDEAQSSGRDQKAIVPLGSTEDSQQISESGLSQDILNASQSTPSYRSDSTSDTNDGGISRLAAESESNARGAESADKARLYSNAAYDKGEANGHRNTGSNDLRMSKKNLNGARSEGDPKLHRESEQDGYNGQKLLGRRYKRVGSNPRIGDTSSIVRSQPKASSLPEPANKALFRSLGNEGRLVQTVNVDLLLQGFKNMMDTIKATKVAGPRIVEQWDRCYREQKQLFESSSA